MGLRLVGTSHRRAKRLEREMIAAALAWGQRESELEERIRVCSGDWEAREVEAAERAAARLRASRIARRPAGAETGGDATEGSKTA